MMTRDAPRARVDIMPLLQFAGLLETAEFGERIPAAQGPVAAACPAVELENPHLVSGLAQLQCRRHAGKAGAENEGRSAFRIALELDWALVSGVGRKAERGHGGIHRGTPGDPPDKGRRVPPT